MKKEYKIIVFSALFGLFAWIVDALLDWLMFYEGTFLELLISDVPKHEVYIRLVIFAIFIIFGLVISVAMAKQKRAEETLIESEEKFRNLAEKSPNMIFINKKGRVVYVNEQCEKVMGYTREEFYSPDFDFMTLIAPESIDLVKTGYTRHMKDEEVDSFEFGHLTKLGKRFEVIITTKLIKYEGETAILGIVTDITERKRAEEELKKREKELENKTSDLEEMNAALRVLLKRREEDKTELEKNVLSNVKELVWPSLEKLKKSRLDDGQEGHLSVLESNLTEIISSFPRQLSSKYLNLTPAEIQIANLVKQGKTTKEIAELLNLSDKTIEVHRRNIRKKFGINTKKTNLRTHLLSIQ